MRKPDFSLDRYAEICEALRSQKVFTVRDYLSEKPRSPCIVLRHDVDRCVKNALAMAELEHQYGIKATYYFRYPKTFNIKAISRIYRMGHEVGYHYETLDKAEGDCKKAVALFVEELRAFRKFFPVNTICMHGNPLTQWDGRDIWRISDFRDYGILGEAYLSLGDIPVYLTDTGRNWSGENNFKDRLRTGANKKSFAGTADMICYLKSDKRDSLYLNCHPERWGSGIAGCFISFLRDCFFNSGKKVLKLLRFGFKERIG